MYHGSLSQRSGLNERARLQHERKRIITQSTVKPLHGLHLEHNQHALQHIVITYRDEHTQCEVDVLPSIIHHWTLIDLQKCALLIQTVACGFRLVTN